MTGGFGAVAAAKSTIVLKDYKPSKYTTTTMESYISVFGRFKRDIWYFTK